MPGLMSFPETLVPILRLLQKSPERLPNVGLFTEIKMPIDIYMQFWKTCWRRLQHSAVMSLQ